MWEFLREAMWSGCSPSSRSVCFHPNLRMRTLRSEDLKRLWFLKESSLLPFPPRNVIVWGVTYEAGTGCLHKTKWVIWFWNNEEWVSAGYKPHCKATASFPSILRKHRKKIPLHSPITVFIMVATSDRLLAKATPWCGEREEKIPTCWLYVVCTEYTNNHQFRSHKKGFTRLRMKSQDKDL